MKTYDDFCQELYKYIPEKYFVKDLRTNQIGHIKIAIVREVTSKMIIRSTDAEATIITPVRFANKDMELVEIPARKFKSREKLLGVEICRRLEVMPKGYHYNAIEDIPALLNPNSLLFGDTVTKSNSAAGFTSRVIYDWAYSLQDVNEITEKLQHNSMGEDGSILKDENDPKKPASNALHSVEYINQGAMFPHFVTLENVHPVFLLHILYCIQHQHSYGAQSTTCGQNMNNHIVAIGFGDFELPINSYLVSKIWNERDGDNGVSAKNLEAVTEFIIQEMHKNYSNLLDKEKTEALKEKTKDLLDLTTEIWSKEVLLKDIYSCLKTEIEKHAVNIGLTKNQDAKKESKKKTSKKKNSETPDDEETS